MEKIITGLQGWISTEEGRWVVIAVVTGLVFLLALRSALRHWQKPRHDLLELELLEQLAGYPPAPPLPASARKLAIYGMPVRLRLLVIGPLGHDAGQIAAEDVDAIVERMVPGMAERLQEDLPRVRLWPTQLSQAGFLAAFRRNTQLPEGDRARRWVLVMGKVVLDGRPLAAGLALQASEEHTLGPVVLQHAHQWMEVMRFQRTES
ncbi:MAG TPA: hypothetical protein PLX97_04965 [Gemmatales bacterium]|nr:hypothetical protein [Gemmatales bacterium]